MKREWWAFSHMRESLRKKSICAARLAFCVSIVMVEAPKGVPPGGQGSRDCRQTATPSTRSPIVAKNGSGYLDKAHSSPGIAANEPQSHV
jgi:hypothetical protein